jgi:hypothetical protein
LASATHVNIINAQLLKLGTFELFGSPTVPKQSLTSDCLEIKVVDFVLLLWEIVDNNWSMMAEQPNSKWVNLTGKDAGIAIGMPNISNICVIPFHIIISFNRSLFDPS